MKTNEHRKVKMIRGMQKIYSEELDSLYSQSSFIKITKYKIIKLIGNVACMSKLIIHTF
jgi:hypothetical protein